MIAGMWRVRCLMGITLLACSPGTGALPAVLEQRFQAEGILLRADDQIFRYTYYSRSTRGDRWEERDASIIVTPRTVLIHKNGKIGLEITPATRKSIEVHRNADRLTISAGSGQSRVSWSFRPPEDAAAWARDVRAVIEAEKAGPE